MVPRLRQRLPRRAACVPVALLTVLALPAAAATLTLPPAATVLQGSSQELDVQVTVEAPTPYGVGDLLYLDADGAGTTTLGDAVLLGSRLAAPVSASDALFGHPYAGQALGRFAFVDLDDSGGLDAEDAVYACACKPLVAAGDLRLTRPAGSVGSQVRTGSPDLPPAALPTENPGSTARFQGEWAAAIKRIELGQPGNPLDDCFHLDHAILEGNPRLDRVVAGDLRLTACLGNPAGTLVQPSATAELRAALPPPASVSIRHLDANADDRYGVGDAVYATTAKTGLVGTALGSWTLRLTPAHGRAAGTLVTPNDPDLFLPASDLWGATVGFSNPDASTANGLDSLSAGDAAYLSPRFVDAGAPFPPASIRLTGRFGSQVQPGDADFWRPLQPIGGRLSFHDADGSRGFSQGDALYLQPLRRETAQQAVAPGFLRLSPVGSLGAGTFVGPSDGDTNRSVLPFSPTWSYHKPLRCLSASGLQPGVTVTFHPVCTAASASHVMVVAANGTAAPGTHTIQVRETGGTPTVAPWTFTVLANATPTPTASATGTPTESQSTSSTLTNGTSTTEGPVDLFTDLIEILAPFGAHGRLALFGAAGAVAMAATTRIKAGGRREGGQDGKEDRSEREEEREEEKEEKAEDEAPCALLHALQVTPDALEVQEESLQAGAWRKQPPAAEPGVAAHLPGKAPWRRTAVAPGAVLLELDSGEGGQSASVERGGLELTRQLRLVHGQGDCTHAFRAEAGLALTAALQAEELDGVLEVHVAVQA
ncbi:MAG TPA: hypothetical protein VHI93_09485, partial [Candidatus Thermoplasmatota archaeon]|nr:hypothetical protein [Candidatus Thermoplasmatota archaeon]